MAGHLFSFPTRTPLLGYLLNAPPQLHIKHSPPGDISSWDIGPIVNHTEAWRPLLCGDSATQRALLTLNSHVITWSARCPRSALSVVVQNDGQAHGVGGEHGAAEVHAGQALGLPHEGPCSAPGMVPAGGHCGAFSPGSQHNVDDALLAQVAALREQRETHRR